MKIFLLTASLLVLAEIAHAEIPAFDVACTNKVEMHAAKGGPIYINGREAELVTISESHYEARLNGLTASVWVNGTGLPEVKYKGPTGKGEICLHTDVNATPNK